MDIRAIYGDINLIPRIRAEAKQHSDRLDFVLTVIKNMQNNEVKYPQKVDSIDLFDCKQGYGGFRRLQSAVWFQAFEDFEPSQSIYTRSLDEIHETREDVLHALGVIHKVRSWLHTIKPKSKESDQMSFEDLTNFSNYFGNSAYQTLRHARATLERYTKKMITKSAKRIAVTRGLDYILHEGFQISGDGLLQGSTLFFRALYESQSRDLSIEEKTLERILENAASDIYATDSNRRGYLDFFYAPGKLSQTLSILRDARILGRFVQGFEQLEDQFYQRDFKAAPMTVATRALKRIENLERLEQANNSPQDNFFANEYKQLVEDNGDALFAIRMALLYRDIVKIEGEGAIDKLKAEYPGIPDSSISLIKFLIAPNGERDFHFHFAQRELTNEDPVIQKFGEIVGDETKSRSLLLFTYAALDYGLETRFTGRQWENVVNLYQNVMKQLKGVRDLPYDPLRLDPDARIVSELLPPNFLSTAFARSIDPITRDIKIAITSGQPVVKFNHLYEQDEAVLQVICEDYRGLLSHIAQTCYIHKVNIDQAKAFSFSIPPNSLSYLSDKFNGALDFFNLSLPTYFDADLFVNQVRGILNERKDIEFDSAELMKGIIRAELHYKPETQMYELVARVHNQPGLLAAMTTTLSKALDINIHTSKGHLHRDGKEVTRRFYFYAVGRDDTLQESIGEYFPL